MNSQQEHSAQIPLPGSGSSTLSPGSAERLASARQLSDQIFAAADSIVSRIRQSDAQRFLEQARQSGGQ